MAGQVKTGETKVVEFTTSAPTTGAAADADSTPTGTLVVNGVDDAATVTVASKGTGDYTATVTLPTLAEGDTVQIRIAATVGGVAGKGIVWAGQGVTRRSADDFNATQKASINTETDTALADYDAPTKAELDAGLAGLNDLDAAGVRSALGLASANLDAQFGGLSTFDPGVDPVLLSADQSAVTSLGGLAVSGGEVNANVTKVGGDAATVAGTVNANVVSVNGTAATTGLQASDLDAIGDAVLGRSVANVEGTAGVYSLCYLVLAATEASRSGGTLTVNKTTGSAFATRTITTAAVDPVTGVS